MEKNSKKILAVLSFFDEKGHNEKLWVKPVGDETNNLKKISPILAKNCFYKKGKKFGFWTSRLYFLTNDFLYYFKVLFLIEFSGINDFFN